jgi:hypothetical protein
MADFDRLLQPETLTELLRQRGVLETGEVIGADSDPAPGRGLVSDVSRLALTYSKVAAGEMPRHLFVKRNRTDTHPEFRDAGRHEVAFYRATRNLGGLPTPYCHIAEHDDVTGESLLVTDDLRESHFAQARCPSRRPTGTARCLSMPWLTCTVAFGRTPDLGTASVNA